MRGGEGGGTEIDMKNKKLFFKKVIYTYFLKKIIYILLLQCFRKTFHSNPRDKKKRKDNCSCFFLRTVRKERAEYNYMHLGQLMSEDARPPSG